MANLTPMLMTRVVGQLTGAMRNLRMYNSAHVTSQKLFDASLALIKEAMGTDNSLSFSLAGNILLLNDKPVSDSRREVFSNFISELGKRSIGQIVFLKGLEKPQLQAFFETLMMDAEQVKAQGGLGSVLVGRGVNNIQIEAISYGGGGGTKAALPEGMTTQDLAALAQMPADLLNLIRSNPQAVAKLISATVGSGSSDLSQALSQLDSVASALAASQGRGTAEYVISLTGVVDNLDAELQKKLLTQKMDDQDWVQVTANMISRLPDEEVAGMMIERQEVLKSQQTGGDKAEEMRKFWLALPVDSGRRQSLGGVFSAKWDRELFDQDDIDYMLGLGVGPEEYVRKQMENLQQLPAAEILNQKNFKGIRRAVKLGKGGEAILREFSNKIYEPDRELKIAAIGRLMELLSDLVSLGRYDAVELMADRFSEKLKTESDDEVIRVILAALENLCQEMNNRDKTAVSSRISKNLSEILITLAEKPVASEIIRILAQAADDFAVRGLIAALVKDTILEKVADALVNLKEKSLFFLMETVKESDDSGLRMKSMYVLNKIGQGVEPIALKYLDETRWFVRRNMALLLALMGSEISIPRLGEAMDDKDARVRKEALKAICKISGKKSEPWLIRGLADKEPEVKKIAIDNLARIGHEASVDALTALYSKKDLLGRGEAPETKKLILNALGQIYLKRSIDFLKDATADRDQELAQSAQTALSELLKKHKPQQ